MACFGLHSISSSRRRGKANLLTTMQMVNGGSVPECESTRALRRDPPRLLSCASAGPEAIGPAKAALLIAMYKPLLQLARIGRGLVTRMAFPMPTQSFMVTQRIWNAMREPRLEGLKSAGITPECSHGCSKRIFLFRFKLSSTGCLSLKDGTHADENFRNLNSFLLPLVARGCVCIATDLTSAKVEGQTFRGVYVYVMSRCTHPSPSPRLAPL
jgi:hypothetical protein